VEGVNISQQKVSGSRNLTGQSEPSSSNAALQRRQKRAGGCGGSGFLSCEVHNDDNFPI